MAISTFRSPGYIWHRGHRGWVLGAWPGNWSGDTPRLTTNAYAGPGVDGIPPRGLAAGGSGQAGVAFGSADGSLTTLGRAVLREIFVLGSLAIPVVAVLNCLVCLNDRRRQSLHDKVFDTLVVKR